MMKILPCTPQGLRKPTGRHRAVTAFIILPIFFSTCSIVGMHRLILQASPNSQNSPLMNNSLEQKFKATHSSSDVERVPSIIIVNASKDSTTPRAKMNTQDTTYDETESENGQKRMNLTEYIHLYHQQMNSSFIEPTLTLWQTWSSHIFPGKLESYWQKIMARNPQYTRKVLNDTEIELYVAQHCPGAYSDLFHSVNPELKAMRADLWRYCALYSSGGVYLDADSGVNLNISFKTWIHKNVVLSQEGHRWEKMKSSCRTVWRASNEIFPERVVTPNSILQWAMVFPLPRHPILKEAMELATRLISAWEDKTDNHWSTHNRIVCLSGPALLSVATNRAYEEAGQDWDKLMVSMEGVDFNGKLLYKTPQSGELYKKSQHYNNIGSGTPIKVRAESV